MEKRVRLLPEYVRVLQAAAWERFGHRIPEPRRAAHAAAWDKRNTRSAEQLVHDMVALLSDAGRELRHDQTDPHRVLASLPLPLYVTANLDPLLTEALAEQVLDPTEQGVLKSPETELCRWTEDADWPASVFQREPGYRPSVARPLVYHLYGQLSVPKSLVLTEDEYFDFMIGVAAERQRVPSVVNRAVTDRALLLLGFDLTDWDFRVFFHSLLGKEGRRRRTDYAHVAVQVRPAEGRLLDTERAARYLERYFNEADISLFWGTVDDFIREFHRRWAEKVGQQPLAAPSEVHP